MTHSAGDALSVGRRQLAPIYGAGFITAFGAYAVAANLGLYALGHLDSLWELGLLLGIYDGAEVLLKPLFGAVVDRKGAKPVMVGGLIAFALASAAFVVWGGPHLLGAARFAQGAAAGRARVSGAGQRLLARLPDVITFPTGSRLLLRLSAAGDVQLLMHAVGVVVGQVAHQLIPT